MTPRRTPQEAFDATPRVGGAVAGSARSEILRRSARVTAAAATGFYVFRYGLDEPVPALYSLFAPIALGLLSSIPGSGRQRAAVMLEALPAGLALVTLGTVLAVHTWAAVLGMLLVGFVLAFAAVAGPRPAGAAPGLQLFYILACFPPYAPQTLGPRLTGLAVGVMLLALSERFLLPRPAGESYRSTLASAVAVAGDTLAGRAGPTPEVLRAAGARLRLSRIPPAERPAGPSRADRGLSQAGSAARRLLEQLAHLTETDLLRDLLHDGGRTDDGTGSARGADGDAACAWLLPQLVTRCDDTAAELRTGRADPAPERMDAAIKAFQKQRGRHIPSPPSAPAPSMEWAPVLRRQAALLGVAESVRVLETAVRVGLDGRRTGPIEPRDLFWYTEAATSRLWLRRIVGNMTFRSVQFHNAVRIAAALGAARLVAGSLELTHGFWVLLAVLTLSRTTAGETWAAIRKAVAGNLVGAVAAGALLIGVGQHTDADAAILAPAMLLAFALGPLLGTAWAQGLFTLVVAVAFAQIAPASWQLAEARIVDVVTGSAIGLLCALLAWPAGARREVRRTMAGLLRECGPLIDATLAVLTAVPPGSAPPPPTLPALHRMRLAESAYAQFRSEPGAGASAGADWHSVLIATHQILLGAHWLPRFDLPAHPLPPAAVERARAHARTAVSTVDRLAARCAAKRPPTAGGSPPEAGGRPPQTVRPPAPQEAIRSSPGRPPAPPLPALVDFEVWLTSLTAQLAGAERGLSGMPHHRTAGDRRDHL
ncbi:FUSC family protein [Streptomyces sp. ME08-AFT2]|uniref:FUSC family protein n=1 Tax=Streptomyces sp. ME08-AFT2 TaxID=3028683 RepID=UPI0029BD2096|nr:FUSC family protein [Streptomyces sp. ME08-AFT2]MDX3314361.1 FUSC family protein [Streptomyces sp. ME08-AFT2]